MEKFKCATCPATCFVKEDTPKDQVMCDGCAVKAKVVTGSRPRKGNHSVMLWYGEPAGFWEFARKPRPGKAVEDSYYLWTNGKPGVFMWSKRELDPVLQQVFDLKLVECRLVRSDGRPSLTLVKP